MGEKKIERQYYTTTEIAAMIGLTGKTIRQEIQRGKLASYMFGGTYLVPVGAFEEWKAKYFKPVK